MDDSDRTWIQTHDNDDLLAQWQGLTRRIDRCQVFRHAVEEELKARMEDDGAAELEHEDLTVKLKREKVVDRSKLLSKKQPVEITDWPAAWDQIDAATSYGPWRLSIRAKRRAG